MGIPTAGVTATWNGTAFGSLVELRSNLGGGLPQNRGTGGATSGPYASLQAITAGWSVDVGSIEVLALGTAAMDTRQWGRKAVLAFGGTAKQGTATVSVLFTTKAVCQSLTAQAATNDVWRFNGVFKLYRETN